MKFWQFLALISGTIVAVVMAFASISYNATLGTQEPAFSWLPLISNSILFACMALAFDLGIIASVFGFLHWRSINRVGAGVCSILFIIASLFSIHSVRGYIAHNLTRSLAPAERSADLYASVKLELRYAQDHLKQLRAKSVNATRRDRAALKKDIAQLESTIHDTRTRLAHTKTGRTVTPLQGLEWFLAVTLWFFNSTCWSAWFGYRSHTQSAPPPLDTVATWLTDFDLSHPTHCTELFLSYSSWCTARQKQPLAKYSFYARLVELGARKFRDGRNGPTKYVMLLARPPNERRPPC